MAKLRIHCFTISLDGFSAGPNQDVNSPLGAGGTALHQWFYPTRAFQKMHGKDGGTAGMDNDFAEQAMLERVQASTAPNIPRSASPPCRNQIWPCLSKNEFHIQADSCRLILQQWT